MKKSNSGGGEGEGSRRGRERESLWVKRCRLVLSLRQIGAWARRREHFGLTSIPVPPWTSARNSSYGVQ